MVEFFVSLSLNQFLVGFAWEKMWLGFHMVLKEHALRFVDCGGVGSTVSSGEFLYFFIIFFLVSLFFIFFSFFVFSVTFEGLDVW